MKWFWILAVFYLVFQVKSGPAIGDTPKEPKKINIIEEMDKDHTNICISEGINIPAGKYTLSIIKVNTTNYQSTGQMENCITFNANIKDWSNMENMKLVVHPESDPLTVYAESSVTKFPEIPFPVSYSLVQDPLNNGDHLLRVRTDDIANFELTGGTELITNATIRYYNGIASSPLTTKACFTTNPNNTRVCDKGDTQTEVTPVDKVIVNSATLQLEDQVQPATAPINLKVPSEDTTISFDIIISPQKRNGIELCPTMASETLECKVTRKQHGSDTYDVRVLKTKEEKITATTIVTIHDRDLLLSQIGTDILEGIWMHNHEIEASNKFYQFYSPAGKLLADVDCSHLTMTHCYGYITVVEKNTYTMKIAPKINGARNTKDENQNSWTVENLQELAILSRHTTRHRNQLMTDVKICFEHLTPPEGRSFSHYEMLIINEKGQWLKHRIIEEEGGEDANEGGLCFAPFTISTKDFDPTEGTKVVVSQRGVDGVTVLATGEAALF